VTGTQRVTSSSASPWRPESSPASRTGAFTRAVAPARRLPWVSAPLLGFGLWGAIDFRQAGRFAEPARLGQELVISLLAAAAWYAAGRPAAGAALAALSIVYHALVYASGERLLAPAQAPGTRRATAREARE
jgi:hypothetical protein